MASFIDRLLGKTKETDERKTLEVAKLLSGNSNVFSSFTGGAYENHIFRTGVDAIARNAAKLHAQHIVYNKHDDKRHDGDPALNHLLGSRPNEQITAYDFIYKMVTHYYTNNNAFAFIDRDGKDINAIYPVNVKSMEFKTDESGALYCSILLPDGKKYILPYDDVIILKRFFNEKELLGDDNSPILSTLQLAQTQNEGLDHAIKSGANLRGLLKYNQVLSPDKLKEEKNRFVNDYLDIGNDGGVAALDAKFDYIPLKDNPVAINRDQVEAVKDKIYSYLGVNEKIIKSEYDEDGWAAFYESTIEPLAVQLSQELTHKLFTRREQAFGNSIRLDSNRLQFSSNETKMKMIKELMPYGIFTINQALDILNLPPVEDGDKRIQTLNVIDADKAADYQQNKQGNNDKVE